MFYRENGNSCFGWSLFVSVSSYQGTFGLRHLKEAFLRLGLNSPNLPLLSKAGIGPNLCSPALSYKGKICWVSLGRGQLT